MGATLFGRFAVNWIGYKVDNFAATQTALVAGWIFTSVSGVLAARSARTSTAKGGGLLGWITALAPAVFLAGLLVFTAILVGWILGDPVPTFGKEGNSATYWTEVVQATHCRALLSWIAIFVSIFLIMWWRVNVNEFSLNDLYANRLIRCYLGASRPGQVRSGWEPKYSPSNCARPIRRPNPITGFDAGDDLLLHDLLIHRGGQGGTNDCYVGPFLLYNTAMNLVQSEELAWQERMAESFVLSPIFCGSKSTGYRRLPLYGGGLTAGRAMSISGAAASPNMGYHSSPALTALMTVFNVRLGWWLGNPAFSKWKNPGPGMGSYLIDEFFGRSNSRQDYVYLSDGGHFENLGIYELVRRRCRCILACDASADPKLDFFDLGSLVRKCRSDLGVRIEIDTAPLERTGPKSLNGWHCAVGWIHYEDVDRTALPGILVYLKPSLTGDEPSDVQNYARQFSSFPHQSTSDQFFSESQFESYRQLGQHVVTEVFGKAVELIRPDLDQTEQLFKELKRRWTSLPADLEKNFDTTSHRYADLQRDLRADGVPELMTELYPELAALGIVDPWYRTPRELAGVHTVSQMLHFMQNAWRLNRLDQYHTHPINRGWISTFERFRNSASFRRLWAVLRGEFTEDFVRFFEQNVGLRVQPARLECAVAGVKPKHPPVAAAAGARMGAAPRAAASRDCDASSPLPVPPNSAFELPGQASDLERPIAFGGESWAAAFGPINHDFQLEWPDLSWKNIDGEGRGLEPLVHESIQTAAQDGLPAPVWLICPPEAANLAGPAKTNHPLASRAVA